MRGQVTIVEQFILFATGLIIFIFIVIGFGGIQGKFFMESSTGELEQIAEYTAIEVSQIWNTIQTGQNVEIEKTLGFSASRNTLLEFDGDKVCASNEEDRICRDVNVPVPLKGKTYSLERFSIFGSEQEIRIG